MSAPAITLVPQRETDDCGIATVAMLTDETYETARSFFSEEALGKVSSGIGVTHADMEAALRRDGFTAFLSIRREYPYSDQLRPTWPPDAVGWRHIVSSEGPDGSAHFSAMDCYGRVFDPGMPNIKRLRDYHLVNEVTVIVRPTAAIRSGDKAEGEASLRARTEEKGHG